LSSYKSRLLNRWIKKKKILKNNPLLPPPKPEPKEGEKPIENDQEEDLDAAEKAKKLLEVLQYLKDKHTFCYYCGTEYDSKEEMKVKCPGLTWEDHSDTI